MEFPGLGSHCSVSTCNRLDFLPVKCDACGKVFCNEHYSYAAHDCPQAALRDVQVPICPLCGIPVPVKRGEQPDIKVGEHIDNNCTSDVALSRKGVYTNKCSVKGCRKKEAIPIICPECGLNFCLSHRHGPDHNCQGRLGGRASGPGPAGAAALARATATANKQPTRNASSAQRSGVTGLFSSSSNRSVPPAARSAISALQGNMSEEEALAIALRQSVGESESDAFGASSRSPHAQRQIDEDEALARALEASEREARRRGITANIPANSGNKNCNVS